jgi:hypothetical protein
MRYMFLTYLDEKAWAALGEAEQQRQMAKSEPHLQELVASGKFLGGAPLEPTSMSTTICNRGGKRVVTDGPFAEAREQLGGYTIVDAQDLDEAIAMAWGFMSTTEMCTIEIRPVIEMPLPVHP